MSEVEGKSVGRYRTVARATVEFKASNKVFKGKSHSQWEDWIKKMLERTGRITVSGVTLEVIEEGGSKGEEEVVEASLKHKRDGYFPSVIGGV